MNNAPRTYRSYLLRLRLANKAGQPVWRASLQEPGSEREVHFEDLAVLCAYLAEEIGVEQDSDVGGTDPEG